MLSPLPDGYGPLWKCDTPGMTCNPHDPCAINPVCGEDLLCRPAGLMNCDDELSCTKDICMGSGLCKHEPAEGQCALPVRVGSGADAGPAETVVRCFKEGDAHPEDPCLKCDPTENPSKWSPANGGWCDDGNDCTKDDYCSEGTCKGTYYGNQCADEFGCTEDLCDGKGGCVGNQLKSDWCLINGVCYKDNAKHPDGSCNECDVTKSQSSWTQITNTCSIDSKCWGVGDKHPLGCAECDPSVSATSWTVKGSFCYIDNTCKKPGDKDAIACAECDPAKDKYGWTPLSGVCKIFDKCYQTGDKHTGGCAECDPAVSATSWTVKGNDCLINNICKKPGDKDSINCATCDPTKDKYDWSPISGLCKISGTCHASGAKHPGGCAQCSPTASATSWTVTTNECLINNVCRKPAEKDLSGCGACDPAKNKYAWSALPGLCKIDGKCYSSGATHPKGCAKCDPAKSTTNWTPTTGCVIDYTCYAAGAKHPAGCGSCDPTKSATSWTVSGASCLVGTKCFAQGAGEPGGCGVCDPTKSKTSWTKPSGCLGVHDWSKAWGSTSSDYPYGIAVDANGNVYVTGYFYNTIDFGGGTLTSKGSADIYIVSFTPGGKHRWSKAFGNTSSDYGYSIAVDGNGNVYISGYFYSSVNFGGTTLTSKGSGDIFLASFDASGKHRWSKSFGSTSSDYGYGVATDPAGNVYLTGSFYYTVDFGGGPIAVKGSRDIFVASYTSTGTHRWSKGFGGTGYDYGYAVAVDGSGNSYITGYFSGTVSFGGTNLVSKGSYDAFLASYDTMGKHRWSKGFGGTSSDYGYSLAVDTSANVYLAGYFYTSIDFGGGTITSKGSGDIYIASFTSGGAHRWSKGFGGTSSDYGYGVAADPSGNAYLTGYFYNTVNFGGSTLTSKGSYDVYAASFTTSGAHRWSRSHGSTSGDYGRKVAVDASGNVYITGNFYYTVDFGGGPFTSAGSTDVFLLKIVQ
jgi:hypothetical protein